MNALEAASLVMIPSGYEDGTLGSLKPTDGTGDFTFSRGSNISATRVNEDGYIEKGYENLLLQSNSFDTTWASVRVSESTGFLGYDGSNDAWKIVPNTQVNDHRLDQSASVSGVWTFSIYAKAAGYDFLYLLFSGIGNSGKIIDISPNQGVVVDTKGGVQAIDERITDAGNDWWKITLTYSGTLGTLRIITLPANDTSSYAGDGTSGILIQDAMLNQGMVAYPYVETTTAPVEGGILEDMPRLDYSNGSCPSLLLEPSRTNVLEHSEYLSSPTFIISNILVDYNSASSPEGKTNAAKFIVTSGGGNTRFFKSTGGSGSQVVSVFAKAGEKNAISVSSYTGTAYLYAMYNLTNGTLIDSNADDTGIEDIGNGWYRVWVYVANSTNRYAHLSIGNSTDAPAYTLNATGNGSDGLYVYGFQAEQDATYPTSYIPTYGVSQTRLEDFCEAESVDALIGSTQGTIFFEGNSLSSSLPNYNYFLSLSDGTSSNRLEIRQNNGQIQFLWRVGGVFQSAISTSGITITDNFKVALKYSSTDIKMFVNGSLVNSYDSPTLYTEGTLSRVAYDDSAVGFKNQGRNKQLLIFPTALSDEACIELTTI